MFRVVRRDHFLPMVNLFDEFLKDSPTEEQRGQHDVEYVSAMALDLTEGEKDFQIHANLPGVKKENVHISVKENHLIIEANHEQTTQTQNHNVIRSERYVGNYQRKIVLSDNIDANGITAKLEDGVLCITVPKKEPEPKKEIKVQ